MICTNHATEGYILFLQRRTFNPCNVDLLRYNSLRFSICRSMLKFEFFFTELDSGLEIYVYVCFHVAFASRKMVNHDSHPKSLSPHKTISRSIFFFEFSLVLLSWKFFFVTNDIKHWTRSWDPHHNRFGYGALGILHNCSMFDSPVCIYFPNFSIYHSHANPNFILSNIQIRNWYLERPEQYQICINKSHLTSCDKNRLVDRWNLENVQNTFCVVST